MYYKVAVYLLLPLMWINLTTAQNGWELFGVSIGQSVYWIMIGLAWYIASRSPYQLLVTSALLLALALRMLEMFGDSDAIYAMRVLSLAIIFTVAGSRAYGRNPLLLHRQLVVFLALSIPVMILQIIGVSSFVMGWSTGYAHDPNILALEEIGTFKEVPLYPTLFVGIDELHYSIGQGRPVGLMHSSNVLSIFVAVAVALNLMIRRTSRLRIADVVVTSVSVLTMSKMVFAITVLLYVASSVLGFTAKRRLGLKLLGLLAIGMSLYYFLFPGLFTANFSPEMIWTSILLRLFGLMHALGVGGGLFYEQRLLIGSAYMEEESYSAVALLLKSELLVPVLFAMLATVIVYAYRVRQMRPWPATPYVVALFVCGLTQFAVPFAAAPSFQFIVGFALFPLFTKLRTLSHPGRGLIAQLVQPKVQNTPSTS